MVLVTIVFDFHELSIFSSGLSLFFLHVQVLGFLSVQTATAVSH